MHFTEPRWHDAGAQPASAPSAYLRDMLTAHGFTTVVDTGSLLSNTVALKRRIELGEVKGPRIVTARLPLYPPDGVPYYLKHGSVPQEVLALLPQPPTPERAAEAVRRNAEGGARESRG